MIDQTSGSTPASESRLSSPIARRAVIAGAAWAVPAVALTTATPALAASTDSDLTFSQFNAQTANVGSYNGRPLYGPTQTPTVDFTIYNAGSGRSPSTSIQLDFDKFYVSAAALPNGWTQTGPYENGSRLIYVFTYTGGGLAGRSSVSGSVRFTIRSDAPYGTNGSSVDGAAQPTSGDVNTSNNSSSTSFYVYQAQTFELGYTTLELQTAGLPQDNGRPIYGPSNGPWLDFAMKNNGPAGVANSSAVANFPKTQVSNAYAPAGWTKISDYIDGPNHVFRWRYDTVIPSGGTAGGRWYFSIQDNLPAGKVFGEVQFQTEPGTGDSNLNNNSVLRGYLTQS